MYKEITERLSVKQGLDLQIPAFLVPGFTDSGFSCSGFTDSGFSCSGFTDSGFSCYGFYRFQLFVFRVFSFLVPFPDSPFLVVQIATTETFYQYSDETLPFQSLTSQQACENKNSLHNTCGDMDRLKPFFHSSQ